MLRSLARFVLLFPFVATLSCSPMQPPSDASADAVHCSAPMIDCAGACIDPNTDVRHCGACGTECAAGLVCVMGACQLSCPRDQALCGSGTNTRCVATRTDNLNCGSCDTACAAGQACVMGTCTTECPTGETVCTHGAAAACVNTQSDEINCGACGVACPAGQACVAGACTTACTAPGAMLCGAGASAHCVDVQNDNANCGSCGTACTAPEFCGGGICGLICPTGQNPCGVGGSSHCVNAQTDNANCGGCGTTCAATQTCVSGHCMVIPCPTGQTRCGVGPSARCVATQTDNANCGGCGHACSAGRLCSAGVCVVSCSTGLTACPTGAPTYCADQADDPLNCGGCGLSCPTEINAAPVCVSGHCAILCNPGFADCNGSASDGCETYLGADANNCGACGNHCAAGMLCSGGACVTAGSVPPSSCAAVLAAMPSAPSGTYAITTGSGSSATTWNAYCDMTDNGGGWTLLLKVAGNSTAFANNAALWTNTTLVGMSSTDLSHTEAKFQGFTNLPFISVMLAFDAATSAPAPAYASFTMPAIQSSLLAVFSSTSPIYVMGSGTAAARASMLGLNPSLAVQPNCNAAGFNLVGASGTGARFGLLGNNEGDCSSPDSSMGLGAAHHPFCGYGSSGSTAIAGSNCSPGCGPCTNGAGTNVTVDPDIVPLFGYLFVR